MINFDDVKKKKKEHNTNWLQILDHPCRILRVSGSGYINSLFNLISHQLDIDKIYLYAKDHTKQNSNS